MKQIFRLSAKEVGTVLAKHVLKENGLEKELTSWTASVDIDPHGNVELELERIPVQLGAKGP